MWSRKAKNKTQKIPKLIAGLCGCIASLLNDWKEFQQFCRYSKSTIHKKRTNEIKSDSFFCERRDTASRRKKRYDWLNIRFNYFLCFLFPYFEFVNSHSIWLFNSNKRHKQQRAAFCRNSFFLRHETMNRWRIVKYSSNTFRNIIIFCKGFINNTYY